MDHEEKLKIQEDIWKNLLDEILLDGGAFKMFTNQQWSFLKKKLYPLTHTSIRDFIPQAMPKLEEVMQPGDGGSGYRPYPNKI